MGLGIGQPVDLDVVDQMAATATANADKGIQTLDNFQQGLLNSGNVGRAASFGQGAIEGRGYQAIEGGLASTVKALA
ncbi:hypothetical protein OG824_05190 [Streptomyces prunicolor]|uniref:hypothetical protein n=1 Tax=Streptomyces prunicolor TaxID=67348 RepID=UPI0022583311|nr:hypothetical protein [Streptomyces prunicolor]MCX5234626.1 hypothetical protein [Streptomyces prunicolor]